MYLAYFAEDQGYPHAPQNEASRSRVDSVAEDMLALEGLAKDVSKINPLAAKSRHWYIHPSAHGSTLSFLHQSTIATLQRRSSPPLPHQ